MENCVLNRTTERYRIVSDILCLPVAQWLDRGVSNAKVMGSSPGPEWALIPMYSIMQNKLRLPNARMLFN